MEDLLVDCDDRFEDEDKIEACEKGANEVAGWGREAAEMGLNRDEAMDTDISDSARFANVVAPDIRRMAGFEDNGHGTYTMGGTEEGLREDELWDAFYEGMGGQISGEYDEYS